MMRTRRAAGFTLLELVLTLGIFTIMALVIIDVFMSSGNEERRSATRSQAVGTSRSALELIVHDIRLSTVDYNFYATRGIALVNGAAVSPVSELVLLKPDKSQVFYRCKVHGDTSAISNVDSPCPGVGGELQRSLNGAILNWETLTVEDADIKTLKFYITPPTDPFAAGATDLRQPSITVVLTTQGTGQVEKRVTTMLQTTATSRIYEP